MKLLASALLACVASAENACEAYQECMNEGHLDPEQCQKEYGNYAWYADENLKEMCIIPPTDDVYSLLTTPRPMMPNSNCPSDHLFRHEVRLHSCAMDDAADCPRKCIHFRNRWNSGKSNVCIYPQCFVNCSNIFFLLLPW